MSTEASDVGIQLVDKPENLPEQQVNGGPLKSIVETILERRATNHFKPDPVPEEYLNAILKLGSQAPSGYNLQPWRFIVVRDPINKRRLQKAAYDQPKIGEAPVVIIFIGMKEESLVHAKEILMQGVERGLGSADKVDKIADGAIGFISTLNGEVWVNRHVMIAFTTIMLAAEAYGLDTAPMEGFDEAAVKKAFDIPSNAKVVALLALGYGKDPDKKYPGRFGLETIAFEETFGTPLHQG